MMGWQLQRVAEKSDAEKQNDKSRKDDKSKAVTKPAPELQALTNLCQALLSANELIYID